MVHLLPKLLECYVPSSAEERRIKTRIMAFIQQHHNCFDRTLMPGHITGSAWLLNRDKTHALVMHHKKLDKWLQPGGHCDGNPNVRAVAIKEAQEESGIQAIAPVMEQIFDLAIHDFPTMNQQPKHLHYDVRFLLQVTSNETITCNQESKELRWIGKDRAQLPTNEPSVVRLFEKWLQP